MMIATKIMIPMIAPLLSSGSTRTASNDRWGVTLTYDKNVERVDHTSAKHGTGNSGGGVVRKYAQFEP